MCSQCSPDTFYRAPSNIQEGMNFATCKWCGQRVEPDEMIADVNEDEFIHERCSHPEDEADCVQP